jgi:ABC-type sugar transport system, periplasmic component
MRKCAIISLMAILVGAVALPGCFAKSSDTEITFWHTYNEEGVENTTLVKTLIPQFEASHPNIKVKAVSVPYDNFREKLLAAIAAGDAPDLIRSDIIWVPEFASRGTLAALDTALPDFAKYKAIVYPGPLSTNLWKGHYYGLPLDTNTKVWLYNQALYAKAKVNEAPKSLSQLESIGAAIKKADPKAYLFAADGLFAWVTLPWIWSFGGDITDPAVTRASGYLNGPDTIRAYEYLLKLYDEGYIAPVIMGDGVDVFTGFASGTYGSTDNGPWSYSILEKQFPGFKFSAAPFPAGKAGSIDVVGGEDINMMAGSKHQAEAAEFIRFLLSRDFQLKMSEIGQVPVRNDLSDADQIKKHPYLGIFMKQLETARARPAHPAWSQMDKILTDAGQYIFRKEKTPKAALDDAARQIDALLK